MFAIEVSNVSKTYRMYGKPVDRLKELILRRPFHTPFHSLSDISFSVEHGGVLGVIGDNGAGKSTLLKILAGTLTPTTGEVVRRGRVAALLELGAGFHPEFTGRQNIHLNATLLGLQEEEIEQREPEIIRFSELQEFIDRPVKTYSSGMHVRLAFSIATMVDPEILIIDEALSVGDAHFQKKCIDRMMRFKESGKTILFCSHSMYLVQELCNRAIWLVNGSIQGHGDSHQVIGDYMAYLEARDSREQEPARPSATALPEVIIDELVVTDGEGRRTEALEHGMPVVVTVKIKCNIDHPVRGHLGVLLIKPDGQLVFVASTKEDRGEPLVLEGEQSIRLVIPSLPLLSGTYMVRGMLADEYTLHLYHEYTTPPLTVRSRRPELGMVVMDHTWDLPLTGEPAALHAGERPKRGAS